MSTTTQENPPMSDPTVEHGFWRQQYMNRPYFITGVAYEEYAPAFQYGWESPPRHEGKTFEQIEAALQRDWEIVRGKSKLTWDHAKGAVRDAWDRITKPRS